MPPAAHPGLSGLPVAVGPHLRCWPPRHVVAFRGLGADQDLRDQTIVKSLLQLATAQPIPAEKRPHPALASLGGKPLQLDTRFLTLTS